jgi:hypothetical protein
MIVALDRSNALDFWGWLLLTLLTGLNVLGPALLEGATKRKQGEGNTNHKIRLNKHFSN